jgi:uncharacterized membrane protein (UPF0127 family)
MRKRLYLLTILVVLGLPTEACLSMRAAPPLPPFCRDLPRLELRPARVQFVQENRVVTVQVEVADTPEARGLGLMCRTSLPEGAGMLFVFEESRPWAFWMKNTLIPLSIAFVDEGGRVVDIQDMDVEPDPTNPVRTYAPPVPVRYAVEVNKGFFQRSGITAGARMEILW